MAGIPSILIDQGFGSLGIEMTSAQLRITTPRPEMQVERIDPEFELEQQRPEFKLNWKKVRSESGLKPPSDYAKAQRDISLEAIKSNTSEAVGDGDFLGNVTAGANRAARLARQKTINTPQVQINLGTIPKSLPEVEWTSGAINVNWTRGSLSIDWIGEYMPQVVIDPPFSIDIYLREKPYIKIMVEDGSAPAGTGMLIDMRL